MKPFVVIRCACSIALLTAAFHAYAREESYSVDMQDVATMSTPAKSRTMLTTEASIAASQNDIRSLDATKRRLYAASHFLGYYQTNGITVGDVCHGEGIDLSPYLTEFQEKYEAEHTKAIGILTSSGLTQKMLDDNTKASIPRLEVVARQAMLDLAKALGGTLSIRAGCDYVATHSSEAVAAQTYNPAMAALFMED